MEQKAGSQRWHPLWDSLLLFCVLSSGEIFLIAVIWLQKIGKDKILLCLRLVVGRLLGMQVTLSWSYQITSQRNAGQELSPPFPALRISPCSNFNRVISTQLFFSP